MEIGPAQPQGVPLSAWGDLKEQILNSDEKASTFANSFSFETVEDQWE